MAYGYYAYIDEAGDEGFTFRDPPDRGSSQWFVLSAVVVRESRRAEEMRALKEFATTITNDWSKLHFRKLEHERRAALSHYLSQRPIRIISICWNKRAITEDDQEHTLDQTSRLHHYAIRYLVERISWLAWFRREPNRPIPCRLVFAKCKNLRYQPLRDYLTHLKSLDTRIRWAAIDTGNILVKPSTELVGLKMADAAASGVYRGLELDRHGRTEPTYCRHFRPITYSHNGDFLRYGLKIMPAIPPVEPDFDNRYSWIAEYE